MHEVDIFKSAEEDVCIFVRECNDSGGFLVINQRMTNLLLLVILLSGVFTISPQSVGVSSDYSNCILMMNASSFRRELEFSTYLGGIDYDFFNAMTIDNQGDIYLAGGTSSADFPTTEGVYDRSHNGGSEGFSTDAFVMKLSNDGQHIIYSTFIGGSDDDEIVTDIAVDEQGNAYIVGYTHSTDFPTTQGSYDRTYNGGEADCFVAKLSPDGSELLFSTFVGGSNYDVPFSIALGGQGDSYVVGYTHSNNFPVETPNEQVSCHTLGGAQDGFIFALCHNGSLLGYSMYLGGNGVSDEVYDIAVDSENNSVVVGFTWSSDFPIVNAFDDELSGNTDGVIAKVHPNGSFLFSTYFGGSDADAIKAVCISSSNQILITGSTISDDFPKVGVTSQILNGSEGVFLSVLNEHESTINFSCVIKGSRQPSISTNVESIVTVSEHEIWLCGGTENSQFPITENALDRYLDLGEGFLTMIDPISSTLNYSTFFGGSSSEHITTFVVDASGTIISCGSTDSPDIPVENALYPSKISPEHYDDGFVFSLKPGVTDSPELVPILPLVGVGLGVAVLVLVIAGVKRSQRIG